jgi:hypothetical protein
MEGVKVAYDSLLEQAGFEPLVPPKRVRSTSGPSHRREDATVLVGRDHEFESPSLHRRVCLTSELVRWR